VSSISLHPFPHPNASYSRILRFARSTEPGQKGFVEHSLSISDLKPGWIVSVTTKHESGNEVAETVTVVMER